MRPWTAVPRSIRFASAIAAVAMIGALGACAEGSTSPKLAAPDSPSFVTSVPTAKTIKVCIGSAPAGTYTITASAITGNVGGDVITSPVVITAPGPGEQCKDVFFRPGSDASTAQLTLTASTGVAGTFSYTCVDDVDNPAPPAEILCVSGTSGTNNAVVQANSFHGTTVTFNFVADVPPPTGGCTVTKGFIKNQFDLLTNGIGTKNLGPIFINGVQLTNAEILEGVSGKGGGLVQLKAQLITALANISLGASTNPAVEGAITSAQALLAANSTDKTAIGLAITTLTSFNEGTAGDGASIHCNEAEEAILKDKGLV